MAAGRPAAARPPSSAALPTPPRCWRRYCRKGICMGQGGHQRTGSEAGQQARAHLTDPDSTAELAVSSSGTPLLAMRVCSLWWRLSGPTMVTSGWLGDALQQAHKHGGTLMTLQTCSGCMLPATAQQSLQARSRQLKARNLQLDIRILPGCCLQCRRHPFETALLGWCPAPTKPYKPPRLWHIPWTCLLCWPGRQMEPGSACWHSPTAGTPS